MEDWAEIRRLHRAEQVPIKEIARRMGVARNTVRAALAADGAPKYSRPARGSLVDAVEPRICQLLKAEPRMPATVIAERIGWEHSITILKDRVRGLRPLYAGIDPADRLVHEPGVATQCDLWFPAPRIPVGHGQAAVLPVLVMTLTHSRHIYAVMLPSRLAGDLLSGMWQLIEAMGAVSKTLVWDRESAIGGRGRVGASAAMFAGTLGTRIRLLPARDPESKGITERNNEFFETSFLPGRSFTGPQDFNAQLRDWLPRPNARVVRATGARRIDALPVDLAAMTALPPVAPVVGLTNRVRLARDYYVRLDTDDYSVDPNVIGRFVDVHASPTRVVVTCDGSVVADHERCWAHRVVVTDPAHVGAAATLRAAFNKAKAAREEAARRAARQGVRHHDDGTAVPLRALHEYDTLYGVDFDPARPADGQGEQSPRTGGSTAAGTATGTATATIPATATATGTATNPGTATGTGTDPATGTGTATNPGTATGTGTGTNPGTATIPATGTGTATSLGTATIPATVTATGTSTATDPATATIPATATVTATGTSTATSLGTATATGTGTNPGTETIPATATATGTGTNPGTETIPATATATSPATVTATGTSTATSLGTATATGTGTIPATGTSTATSLGTATATGTGTVELAAPIGVVSLVAEHAQVTR
jgi:transposase